MPSRSRTRLVVAASAFIWIGTSVVASAQAHPRTNPPAPAPIERRPPSAPAERPQASAAPAAAPGAPKTLGKGPNSQHLATWLDQHSAQTTVQRQQALEKEPGFRDLPAPTQQRMRDRLAQLDNMPPQQRAKIISRTEAMERLTPEQRGQVRSTMQELSGLPPASRRAVSRTFRTLRGMPPQQRAAYLNSPEVRSQFTDQERSTLTNLMTVEPYLPPRTADPANPQ